MAGRPFNTYMAIPPPPLSDFYLEKSSSRAPSSSASVSDTAYDRSAQTHIQRAHVKIAPAEPSSISANDVPPLAVYHICRICVRPRSARYHREHPIPIDGLPPPPGICRRCRITSVNGSERFTEVVEYDESGKMKIGTKCLVPDEAYISQEEMKAKRARELTEWVEVEPARMLREDDIYRRVRVASAPAAPPSQQTEVIYRNVHHLTVPPPPPSLGPRPVKVRSIAQEAVDYYPKTSTMDNLPSSRIEAHASALTSATQPPESADLEIVDSNRATKGSTRNPSIATASSAAPSPKRRHSNHTQVIVEAYRPERSEAEIRRLARDEVERYRQAERLMEAHGRPYARGKLVPVDQEPSVHEHAPRIPVARRIAMEKDVVAEKPWVQKSERTAASTAPVSRREFVIENVERDRDVEIIYATAPRRAEGEPPRYVEHAKQRIVPSTTSSSTSSDKTRWPVTANAAGQGHRSGRMVPLPDGRHAMQSSAAKQKKETQEEVMEGFDRASEVSISASVDVDTFSAKCGPDESCEFEEMYFRADLQADGRSDSKVRGSDDGARVRRSPHQSKAERAFERERGSATTNLQEESLKVGPHQDVEYDDLRIRATADVSAGAVDEYSSQIRSRPPNISERPEGKAAAYRQNIVVLDGRRAQSAASAHSERRRTTAYPRDNYTAAPEPSSEYYYVERKVQPSAPPARIEAQREPESQYYYVERKVEADGVPPDARPRGDTRGVYYVEEERFVRLRRSPQEQQEIEDAARGRNRDNEVRPRASDISSRVHFAKQVEFSPTPPNSDASSREFRESRHIKEHRGQEGPERGTELIAEYERRSRSRSRLSAEYSGRLPERDFAVTEQGDRGRIVGVVEVDRDRTPRPTRRDRRPSGSSETATLPSNVRPLARAKSESPSRERLLKEARRQKRDQRRDGLGPYAIEEKRPASMEVQDGSISSASSRENNARYRTEYSERRDRRGDERRGKR
ncbi:hypothetical protein TI39_contig399g00004 [Zymoseptoria brevis]|uniref:Uncharacterized protein n=1 Tax=Zymoseptoria brevis TaxID=1047168 RepID=A0A0F4GNJ5_9PEZI|nr:hypothetical protein TI39_contig399g00004 [Zymoseptoria brevis]